MSEFERPDLRISTPEQALGCFEAIKQIYDKPNTFGELPLSPEQIPGSIKDHLPDGFIGGQIDRFDHFEAYATKEAAQQRGLSSLGRKTGEYFITAFNDKTSRYRLVVFPWEDTEQDLTEGSSYKVVATVTIERNQWSNILPVDIRQEYEYEIWQNADSGAYFIHTEEDASKADIFLDHNERGRAILHEKMDQIHLQSQIRDMEAVANNELTAAEILDVLQDHPQIYQQEEPETDEEVTVPEEVVYANNVLNERAEGVGLVPYHEAEDLLTLLQQLAAA